MTHSLLPACPPDILMRRLPDSRTWIVDQRHPDASDFGEGTPEKPFLSINQAASLAEPGDTILVYPGVYRERVNPRRGGKEGLPITYQAAEHGDVFLRGSEVFAPDWEEMEDGILRGSLGGVAFGTEAYHGHVDENLYGTFNPFHRNFNAGRVARPHSTVIEELQAALAAMPVETEEDDAVLDQVMSKGVSRRSKLEAELLSRTRERNRRYLTTLGQLFVDGVPFVECESFEDLRAVPDSWMVAPEGDALMVHFSPHRRSVEDRLVEISVRHTVFSPLARGLGFITVKGFVIEHAANFFTVWDKDKTWPQVGALSTRSGHHWVVENNTIRFAKGTGMDCGSEGRGYIERGGEPAPEQVVGHHLIQGNSISDNGHCGLSGNGHWGTRVIGNIIERNNRDGHVSPWWEFAGIKFHFFFDGLIEGNLIRDNEAHGIWLDNKWRGSRVTRNVIINNLWSGINVELGRGPVLIDHNIIALTRQGDGIYGHDVSEVTVAHNLLYANANFGVWFSYATPRVRPEDGCWDHRILNNMILGNRAGAIGLPLPFQCGGRNVSDGNLFMGAGAYLDEGSGPRPVLFQITNATHSATSQEFHRPESEMQTPEIVWQKLEAALDEAGVPDSRRPKRETWAPHYLLPLELWRASLRSDTNSKEMRSIRDGLQSLMLSWQITFDESLAEVRCEGEGLSQLQHDFFECPLPNSSPLPGPFQNLEAGFNKIRLWPV